jgi:predicted nucleic acid-binding Zn ribbon protein
MKEAICENCGTTFNHYPSNNRRYCSKSCYASHQKIWARTPTCNGGVTKGFTGRNHSEETKNKIRLGCKGKGRPAYPLISLKCKNCQNEFKTKRFNKNRQFCSKECQYNYIRTEKYCIVCNKKFYSGVKQFCSSRCRGIGQRSRVNKICIQCGGDFQVKKAREDSVKFCCKNCKDIYQVAENNPAYVHGNSNYPYPKEFNEKLREEIRERDMFKCQLCGKTQYENNYKLDIHHIDYNKDNCKPVNLIALCKKCHMLTNRDRIYWLNFFTQGVEVNE